MAQVPRQGGQQGEERGRARRPTPSPARSRPPATGSTTTPAPSPPCSPWRPSPARSSHRCRWRRLSSARRPPRSVRSKPTRVASRASGSTARWAWPSWCPAGASSARSARAAKNADEAIDAANDAENAHAGGPTRPEAATASRRSTPVLMADGSRKPIGEVQVGDQVVATDPETGQTDGRARSPPCTATWTGDLTDLTVGRPRSGRRWGRVHRDHETTWNHPFWNVTRRVGRRRARSAGDRLLTARRGSPSSAVAQLPSAKRDARPHRRRYPHVLRRGR